MKLLVFTIGSPEAGSTKYRILQYADFLKSHDVQIEYVHRNKIDRSTVALAAEADVVFNQKCLFRTSLAGKIIRSAKRVLFDFDDAIWTRPGRGYTGLTQRRVLSRFKPWLTGADVVIAANRYLADYACQWTDKVRVIPMGLDLEHWRPRPQDTCDDKIRIGWAGAPGNLKYLQAIDDHLRLVVERNANVKLMVYCGQRPELKCPFEHVPFQPGTEPDFTRQLDIGLLPLEDDEYLRGKSPIKAIQYLACGVPVVGNIYGATMEILGADTACCVNDGSWLEALEALIHNSGLREKMARASVDFVKRHHDFKFCGKMLFDALSG